MPDNNRHLSEDAPKRVKMNPVAATSDEGKLNHYEVDMSNHNWSRSNKARHGKPKRKDHR